VIVVLLIGGVVIIYAIAALVRTDKRGSQPRRGRGADDGSWFDGDGDDGGSDGGD
jgi:hypothetical protein